MMSKDIELNIKRACTLKDEIVTITTYYFDDNGGRIGESVHRLSIDNARAVSEFIKGGNDE